MSLKFPPTETAKENFSEAKTSDRSLSNDPPIAKPLRCVQIQENVSPKKSIYLQVPLSNVSIFFKGMLASQTRRKAPGSLWPNGRLWRNS